MVRAFAIILMLHAVAARAGTLVGKLELPAPPERPPPATHGFLDRTENPLAPVKPYGVTQQLVVELDGDEKPATPPQVAWHLLGESFDHPVIAAPAGAQIVIHDDSKTARTLVAKEDGKLVPPGPVNPGGTKEFRTGDPGKVYTIGDADAPHLKGVLIVVNTQYIAYPDELGRFEIADVPPGSYKLRIWYGGKLLDRADDDVNIAAKGKTDFNPKVPAGMPVKK
ncbi:MAG TPA: hypothetical protein VGF94_05220 [Kofleriaceae bacterium]